MKVLTLTREYPPYVYGGAGVHVDHLTRELARIMDVEVRCFGDQSAPGAASPSVRGFVPSEATLAHADRLLRRSLEPLSVGVSMAATPVDADVLHCHTWYSMAAGFWMKLLYDLPLVITTHSLEPLRPWKAEQLGRGYQLSSWIEKTAIEAADAIVAVSSGTRREVLDCYDVDPKRVHVVYNGVDPSVYRPTDPAPALAKYGIPSDRPYLLFVGRVTRQKGVTHLVRALEHVTPQLNAVLCAGAPDTSEIEQEMEAAVSDVRARRGGVYWVRDMVPVPDLAALYSGASLFVCPSIYEPFGIINLEAMATGCPVVASSVGGIPEVVVDGETGVLVSFEPRGNGDFAPKDPERFAVDLAAAIESLHADPDARARMGEAGRKRVAELFTWPSIAAQTKSLYERVVAATSGAHSR